MQAREFRWHGPENTRARGDFQKIFTAGTVRGPRLRRAVNTTGKSNIRTARPVDPADFKTRYAP
jgi:hypothetical protein